MREYFPKDELFEKLASIEHERWADWQRYCLDKLRDFLPTKDEEDGRLAILLEVWNFQIKTPYKDLVEEDKDKDREQVMRYWHLII